MPWIAVFVSYQRFRARRQDLQRLQELDHVVLFVCRQSVERFALGKGLAVVCFHSFSGRRELPVMHESAP